MKVNKYPGFDYQYPERFNWGLVDSSKLEAVAQILALETKNLLGLRPDDRILVPGLRFSLNRIAEVADIN